MTRHGDLDDYVDGPPCPRGCGVVLYREHRVYRNMKGPPYHDCPRSPHLLARIAIDASDAAMREEFGNALVDEMREYVEKQSWYGDRPRELEWANRPVKGGESMKWVDDTAYSRDGDRARGNTPPRTWRLALSPPNVSAISVKVFVHRVFDPVDAWFLTCEAYGFNGVKLDGTDLEKAKKQAYDLVVARACEWLSVLEKAKR